MKMFLDDYDKFKKDTANEYNSEFQIVKEVDESYNYVVFISKKDVDFLNIETFFNLEKVYDLHRERNIGLGRAISADQLLKLISFVNTKGLKNIDEID